MLKLCIITGVVRCHPWAETKSFVNTSIFENKVSTRVQLIQYWLTALSVKENIWGRYGAEI